MPALWIGPNARQAWHALGWNREVGAGTDQDFFEAPHEVDSAKVFSLDQRFARADEGVRRSTSEAAEVEDGIADDLAWTVKSYVTTAVALESLDPALGKEFRRRDHVRGLRVAAECDDRRVFEQK